MAPTVTSLSVTNVSEHNINNCNQRLEINCLYVETEVKIRSEVHIAKKATQNYREVQRTNVLQQPFSKLIIYERFSIAMTMIT